MLKKNANNLKYDSQMSYFIVFVAKSDKQFWFKSIFINMLFLIINFLKESEIVLIKSQKM